MGTWACATCQRLNAGSGTVCVSCGADGPLPAGPVGESTVSRGPKTDGGPPTLRTGALPGPSRRPVIIGALIAAAVIVAVGVGIALGASGGQDEIVATEDPTSTTTTTTAAPPSTTTSTAPPTTAPPTTAGPVSVPIAPTLPPTTTTTAPPPPPGIECPQEDPFEDGHVTIRTGGDLNIRVAPSAQAMAVDTARNGETISSWPMHREFEWPWTFIIVEIGDSGRCGWASATNVTLPDGGLGAPPLSGDGCVVYYAATMSVMVCPDASGGPSFEVAFAADPGGRRVFPAAQDGGGWKAQDADVLYKVDDRAVAITQNGDELLFDPVFVTDS